MEAQEKVIKDAQKQVIKTTQQFDKVQEEMEQLHEHHA